MWNEEFENFENVKISMVDDRKIEGLGEKIEGSEEVSQDQGKDLDSGGMMGDLDFGAEKVREAENIRRIQDLRELPEKGDGVENG